MSQTAHQRSDAAHAAVTAERHARRLARRIAGLDEAKRSFLRVLSHELRTPLNAIIGFSEIIDTELFGPVGAPQYREYARHIRTSGERLLKLVNQVLEIARLEGRVIDLDPQAECLDHALDDVRDQLREDLREQSGRIEVEGEGALPAVLADGRGLRSLLMNLMQNAVLHGPRCGVVRVRALRQDEQVLIEIEDQGPGIDPADIPRLMSPFEQGEEALTRAREGAGLGLPIARLLAQAMSGELTLLPSRDGGVLARVSLPAA